MTITEGIIILQRYKVLKRLGEGAMGEVWFGNHMDLDMPVAIKILKQPEDEDLLVRFRREARMMAKVQHPNVVRVLDFGLIEGNLPCIVMEYIKGRDLDQVVRKDAMPWHRVIELMAQFLKGIAAIHTQGIIHRDVKPANAMVLEDNKTLKVVDFGVAKASLMESTRLTQTGTIVGTPFYMSPEQLLGEELTPMVDVYAMGIMLHEMLSKVPPSGDSMSHVLKRLREPLAPIDPKDEKCPPSIIAIVSSMVDFRPTFRPTIVQTLSVFEKELTKHTAHAAYDELPAGIVMRKMRRSTPSPKAKKPKAVAPSAKVDTIPHTPSSEERTPSAQEKAVLTQDSQPTRVMAASEPSLLEPTSHSSDVMQETSGAIAEHSKRTRAIMVVKLPPSRLKARAERTWLREVIATHGTSFTIGTQFWVAVVQSHEDTQARGILRGVRDKLKGRYGKLMKAKASMVPETFMLTPAVLSGAEEMPEHLQSLIQSLL